MQLYLIDLSIEDKRCLYGFYFVIFLVHIFAGRTCIIGSVDAVPERRFTRSKGKFYEKLRTCLIILVIFL